LPREASADAGMPSPTEITVAQLSRLVGLPGAPVLADVRTGEEFDSDPQLIPTAHYHADTSVEVWRRRYAGQPIVVLCQSGGTSSQAVAARLRQRALRLKPLKVATAPGGSPELVRYCQLHVRYRMILCHAHHSSRGPGAAHMLVQAPAWK
jgi:rhodanese-related sulfurtransferase